MYSQFFKGNEIFIKDINSDTVIVGYVGDNKTIHYETPKMRQAICNPKSAPVVLRFPRIVDSFGNYITIDIDNRVCRYTDDTLGLCYPTVTTQNQPIVLTTYPGFPIYIIQDHQCAPVNPVYSAADMVLGKPDIESEIIQSINSHNAANTKDDTAAETETADIEPNGPAFPNENKSKRILEYDRYFTRENKIYSYFKTSKGEEIATMLCNFAVIPDGIESIVDKDGKTTQNLRLVIHCGDQIRIITIQPDKTEKLIKEIQKQIPQAYLNPCEKRAAKQLSAYVSMMFEKCFYAMTVKTTGWVSITSGNKTSRYVYANDSMGQNNAFKCETGKRLLWIRGMSQQESFFHAVRMLKLSEDMRKTLPLWLVSHLGVLFSLFEEAGFAPRFVTYLYGASGSLKTSVSKIFFKILKDDFNDISANFNDTMTALEIKMGTTKDEVLLVDDYRPSALRTEAARMNGNFERLVRFYGDGIGKGRGSVNLSLRSEFKPKSMCAVTGEFLHGTASSLLRLLIIHVNKKTYNKKLLKFYQDNPLVFTTHIKYFTDYVSEKYKDIVAYISEKFPEYRAMYSHKLTESRIVDAAVCLRITADIVLDMYAKECGLVVEKEIPQQMDIFHSVILDTMLESQALACHLEPYDMYLYAMVRSINDKKLIIGDGKQNYRMNGDTAGFIDRKDGYLYIRPQDTYNQVVRYWAALDRPFSATDRSIRQELAIHQFILTQSEESKDNTTRVVRLAGNVERRFLVFDMKKLESRYGKISL